MLCRRSLFGYNLEGDSHSHFYAHSGNDNIARINGIMSQLVYLSDIREKVISVKKIESLTLQRTTTENVKADRSIATYSVWPRYITL